MILGWAVWLCVAWGCDLLIKRFGINDLGLVDRFVEGGEIERLVFVADIDLAKMIFMDGDFGLSQGIVRSLRLDLIDDILVLDGQVFGDRSGFLPGQDQVEVFGR